MDCVAVTANCFDFRNSKSLKKFVMLSHIFRWKILALTNIKQPWINGQASLVQHVLKRVYCFMEPYDLSILTNTRPFSIILILFGTS